MAASGGQGRQPETIGRQLELGMDGTGAWRNDRRLRKKEMRPVVTVYNSPVLPSEPSSRRPVQPLRIGPSSPTEPGVLRHPIPQPFRAGPLHLTVQEWEPCGPLVGDRLESFPSLAGFLTGRMGNISRRLPSPQYGTFVYKQPLVVLHSAAT